jgi:DNA-binding MarR family transcriptional regulator
MENVALLEALADGFAAASNTFRRLAEQETKAIAPLPPNETLDRIFQDNPNMGHRQRQVLALLVPKGESGTDTGWLYREMGYDQANVYLVLQSLIQRGIVEKLTDRHPHTYRLAAKYR